MYRMAVLLKIKPHFDAVGFLSNFLFIRNPSKKQKLNA